MKKTIKKGGGERGERGWDKSGGKDGKSQELWIKKRRRKKGKGKSAN